jgi:hypothetical protein
MKDKETIEPQLADQSFKVPVEAIKNFDEEKTINIFLRLCWSSRKTHRCQAKKWLFI